MCAQLVEEKINVLGGELKPCSIDPITGWFRNGCCDADQSDAGRHHVCVVVDEKFLRFSASVGNDLSTPRPEYNFPGLQPGNQWCLCALRWKQAFAEGMAPPVDLEATHEMALEVLNMADLESHAM